LSRRMKDSGVEWIGEIPEDWGMSLLGNHFRERTERVSDFDYEPLSVTKRGILRQLETVAKTSNRDDRKKVCINDFVINSRSDRKQSCGLSSLNGSVSVINTVLAIRDIDPEYAKYLLDNYGFAEEFYRWGTGIVDDLWSTRYSSMKKIRIPIPPQQVQSRIATYLDQKTATIDHIIEKTKESIEDYKLYKQSLISEAVTKGLSPDMKLKDSGVEWIGEMPEHWAISKIKHVADFAPNLNLEFDEEQPIGYVPMDRVKSGYLLPGESLFQNLSTGLVPFQEGDIVMAKVTPCFENGNIAVAKNLSQRVAYGSSELFVFRSHGVDTDYLYYFLQTNLFKDASVATMTGTGGLKRVSSSFVRNAYLPMPSVVEQKEISSHLGREIRKMEETIIQKEQLIEDLEAYKKSLIYEVVTGKREVQ
jgi:type I restriction enzyme S subunit